MRILYLMQGVPGSGKSTIANALAEAYNGIIFSTDEFWFNADGKYCYDPDKAGIAHAWNQRRCAKAMTEEVDDIIIDNTNITQREADPYITLAKMYDYIVQIVRVEAPYQICVQRQDQRSLDRRIPVDVIANKFNNMERLIV